MSSVRFPPGLRDATLLGGTVLTVADDGLKFAARALTERNPDRAVRRGAAGCSRGAETAACAPFAAAHARRSTSTMASE